MVKELISFAWSSIRCNVGYFIQSLNIRLNISIQTFLSLNHHPFLTLLVSLCLLHTKFLNKIKYNISQNHKIYDNKNNHNNY